MFVIVVLRLNYGRDDCSLLSNAFKFCLVDKQFFSSPTLILSPATLGAIYQEVSFRVDSIILFGITTKLPSCLQGDEVSI